MIKIETRSSMRVKPPFLLYRLFFCRVFIIIYTPKIIPKCKKSHSNINAKNVPKIRNGPNGISLLIVNLLENKDNEVLPLNFFNKALKERIIRPTPPPIQKASTIAYIPEDNPKRKPMP